MLKTWFCLLFHARLNKNKGTERNSNGSIDKKNRFLCSTAIHQNRPRKRLHHTWWTLKQLSALDFFCAMKEIMKLRRKPFNSFRWKLIFFRIVVALLVVTSHVGFIRKSCLNRFLLKQFKKIMKLWTFWKVTKLQHNPHRWVTATTMC